MAMVRFMLLRCTLRGVAHFASLVGEVWGGVPLATLVGTMPLRGGGYR